jgi:hypothetical protein
MFVGAGRPMSLSVLGGLIRLQTPCNDGTLITDLEQ